MFPWTKSFVENHNKFEPKTIFFGSEGANVVAVVDLLIKKLISQIDEKDYHNLALDQIASPNFYLLKADEGKSFITMDQLRAPKDFLTLNTSKNRVLYIQSAEQIRIDGYNALLKVSEEANENIYIIIATSNLNAVPATILSRFHKVKISKPSPEEVMTYAKDKGIDSEQGVMEFTSYNPWILEDHNEKILDALHGFGKQISDKKISSKDRLELDTFVDYLIFKRKKKVNGTGARDNLQKILELNDIKKSLNSPNNLSIDIAKLRITSCL